jgi:hypothetical protein
MEHEWERQVRADLCRSRARLEGKRKSRDKPPASTDAPASKNVSGAAPAGNKQADQTRKPIAWLPVDGVITIYEDYAASPAKKA